jgi:hypothetical protein
MLSEKGTLTMRVAQKLKVKLIDPIIDQIVDRMSDRMTQLFEKFAASSSAMAKNSQARENTANPAVLDSDLQRQRQVKIESMSYAQVIGKLPPPEHPPSAPRRQSQLCKQADFSLDAYRFWSSGIGLPLTLHRKHWEFFFICQALFERGLLNQDRKGLGFGVGREPLPALFASLGCTVVATDQPFDEATSAGWQKTGQHSDGLAALERADLCAPATFYERVSFEPVDMNEIPDHLANRFDFCWSACSLEHLGSLDHGLRFIENSLKALKIDGVAVHTTEFNVSSNKDTLESRDLSLYRKCDIEKLFNKLEQAGHHVEPLDLSTGTTFIDGYIDLPPYHHEPHLRLRIAGYDCTSIGLIVTRGQ